jgi:hypothetical protein
MASDASPIEAQQRAGLQVRKLGHKAGDTEVFIAKAELAGCR